MKLCSSNTLILRLSENRVGLEKTDGNRNDLYVYMLSIFAYMPIYKTNTSNIFLQNLGTTYSRQTTSMPSEKYHQVIL